tara:strand:- start:72 stop:281 length:210 start_codon:yes stop_codon:yes gene_type:complete
MYYYYYYYLKKIIRYSFTSYCNRFANKGPKVFLSQLANALAGQLSVCSIQGKAFRNFLDIELLVFNGFF